jgi:hypothetical protein
MLNHPWDQSCSQALYEAAVMEFLYSSCQQPFWFSRFDKKMMPSEKIEQSNNNIFFPDAENWRIA